MDDLKEKQTFDNMLCVILERLLFDLRMNSALDNRQYEHYIVQIENLKELKD